MEERRARRAHGTCRWLILGLVLAFQARFAHSSGEINRHYRATLMADDL
jgi:hypothetical protein